MRPKYVFLILSLWIILSSSLMILVSPAQSQVPIPNQNLPAEPELFGSLEPTFGSPALIATHIFTKTIEAVVPFSEYRYFFQMNIFNMPSGNFTWTMSNLNPDTISNLVFSSIPVNGCNQQSDMDIECEDITSFYLEFRYTNVYTLQGNTKDISAGANFSGFSLNHFLTLRYIDPLEFIESIRTLTGDPLPPTLHEDHTLQWQILNSSQGGVRSVFLDPRISILFLPVLLK